MNPNKAAASQYLEKQIMNSSAGEQIVMLYDGAIRFLNTAKAAIAEGDIKGRYEANKKASDIIAYLMSILDLEKGGKIAENLNNLYFYMLNRLMEVDIKNNPQAADDVIDKLKTLRKSWAVIAKQEEEKKHKASSEVVKSATA